MRSHWDQAKFVVLPCYTKSTSLGLFPLLWRLEPDSLPPQIFPILINLLLFCCFASCWKKWVYKGLRQIYSVDWSKSREWLNVLFVVCCCFSFSISVAVCFSISLCTFLSLLGGTGYKAKVGLIMTKPPASMLWQCKQASAPLLAKVTCLDE